MNHQEEVMYAIARFMDKPWNTAYAAMDLFDKLKDHGVEAVKEYEEDISERAILEAENEEMRRLLLQYGIKYRGTGEAA